MKILVTPTSFGKDKKSKAKEILEAFTGDIVYNPYPRPLNSDEIIPLLEGVDGYIAGLDYITADVIKNAPSSLKVISRYGVGYDRVDLEAAREKGITVTYTPGVNSESVADLAFGLMLSVARRIPALDKKVKSGEWPRASGIELYKKTIGILGFGAIGKAVARRAKGFSMNVMAYDPYFDEACAASMGVMQSSLEQIIEKSDVISLHLPLNEKTKNIINEKTIEKMKNGAILINTSRGGLMDEKAVYEALSSGKLGGLGIDAFEKEPPGDSPLLKLDNVVATPHAGAHTLEAVDNMGMLAVQNLIDVLQGGECKFIAK